LWPGRRDGDDVLLGPWPSASRLRQQVKKSRERASYCLADFIDTQDDWIGGFAVGIHGIDEHYRPLQGGA
jgi:5-methyltetrahydrofolate--homocysteine methyltransferase